MSTYDYFTLAEYDKDQISKHLEGKPWTFLNLLPTRVLVYVRDSSKNIQFLGTIIPHGKLVTSQTPAGMPLKKDLEIHVLFPELQGSQRAYEFTRPTYLTTESRLVRIGDIVYKEGDSNAKGLSGDIPGIRVVNHLAIPLDIWYHKMRIAQVRGDDGTEYMGGSPNSVYINNNRDGFRLGDELSFVFAYNQRQYASVLLNDNYLREMHVGVTNQKFTPPDPDTYAYRLDAPTHTGITFYETTEAYKSRPTQPNAMF